MTPTLSGSRRPTEHIGVPLLNEIADALKEQAEIILSDDQKQRLEVFLQSGQIMDSITGHSITSAHEIVSSRRVRVLRGNHGMGLEWRFEEI